jgi:hypothetical protein
MSVMGGGQSPRAPGPKLWCPNGCGNWVGNIGVPGPDGAVMVLLGREPFWFCGLPCASSFLEDLYQALYERSRHSAKVVEPSFVLSLNTLSEN